MGAAIRRRAFLGLLAGAVPSVALGLPRPPVYLLVKAGRLLDVRGPGTLTGQFVRYTATDALCCPSTVFFVEYLVSRQPQRALHVVLKCALPLPATVLDVGVIHVEVCVWHRQGFPLVAKRHPLSRYPQHFILLRHKMANGMHQVV